MAGLGLTFTSQSWRNLPSVSIMSLTQSDGPGADGREAARLTVVKGSMAINAGADQLFQASIEFDLMSGLPFALLITHCPLWNQGK